MDNFLIIGNGAAGMEAAITIRKQLPEATITIITESRYLHYFRPKLVHFLAEDQSPDNLVVYNETWYQERKIRNILGRRVVSLDTAAHTVTDSRGEVHSWDRLLLATGSRPFVPPVPGIDRPGVFTLRSVTDANRIKDFSKSVDHVLVVGGGLLGLENAYSLLQLGKKVTVVEFASWLLPRQLDKSGGEYLQKMLEEKGLQFILGDQVKSLVGEGPGGAVSSVLLASGKSIPVGAVLVSAGVRGDTEFLKGTPVAMGRGVVVDDFMATNVPGIWAAGDVAEHRGICYGLWTVAKEQGRIAGFNMAGVPTAYEGSIPSSLLKITGINVFSMGDPAFQAQAEAASSTHEKTSDDGYRKLVMDDEGKARTAMVVGDKAAIQTAQKVMTGRADPEEFKRHTAS